MGVMKRCYDRARDYERVNQFLVDSFVPDGKNLTWPQPRWEYMHFHPMLETQFLDRIGIWEEEDKIVALVNYEDRPGLAYFHAAAGYDFLKAAMLDHAEVKLSAEKEGKLVSRALIHELDSVLIDLVQERGYQKRGKPAECISLMDIPVPFPEIPLKTGFHLADMTEEDDLVKLDRCLYRGFNHLGDPPPEGVEGRKLMQSTPNFDKTLNIVAVAPDGSYVSYSGIWVDVVNQFAYVEPVATDPDFRRMGLGKACVLECVRRAGLKGAKVAYVGSDQAFYHALGFETKYYCYLWEKEL